MSRRARDLARLAPTRALAEGPSARGLRHGRLRDGRGEAGQSLVEFALILTPLLLILLGIIQVGLILNTQVTITNAAREGARQATIYPYTVGNNPLSPPGYTCLNTPTKATNDACRNLWALYGVVYGLRGLSANSPQFGTTSWVASGTDPNVTYTNGDITVAYAQPSGVPDTDPRTGEQVTVQVTYHQDLFIPFISRLLPHDANNRLSQVSTVTMVIN